MYWMTWNDDLPNQLAFSRTCLSLKPGPARDTRIERLVRRRVGLLAAEWGANC